MYPIARLEQEKHAYQCIKCAGEGSYVETMTIIRQEKASKYKERMMKLKEQRREKSSSENNEEGVPRKVIFQETK